MRARTLVFGSRPGDRYRAGRTLSALRLAGVSARDVSALTAAALAAEIAATSGAIWLVRAGAWPARPNTLHAPPSSTTGLPLCAFGLIQPESGTAAAPDGE